MQSTLRTGVAVAALALIPVADAAAASYGSRPLREGTSGTDVKRLQRYLDRAGYDTTADGMFGPATARSVRSFEAAEERRPNGAATGFMSWGERGRGTWVTIRTNPSHAYMIVAGLRFDTSARRQTGKRWSDT